jgi:glucose repression regulatory protein TUP1
VPPGGKEMIMTQKVSPTICLLCSATLNVYLAVSVSSQVNELNIIRQSLYDLETQHSKVRQSYEEELNRLRSELLASRQGLPGAHSTVGPGSIGPPGGSGPSTSLASLPPGVVRSYNDPYYGPDRDRDRDRDRGRDRERDGLERDRDRGDRDRDRDRERERPVDGRESKRLKTTDRIKLDRPGELLFSL